MAGSSTIEELLQKHQVFISFRGELLVHKFVGHLYRALRSNYIKVFIDNAEARGQQLQLQFRRIEESTIALVIFSGKYTESTSCLRELARIKDCMDEGKMKAIPIFYKLDPSIVKDLEGQFGDAFRYQQESHATKKMWKKALKSGTMGFKVDQYSDEAKKLEMIVNWVKVALMMITLKIFPSEGSQDASVDPSTNIETGISAGGNKIVEEVNEVSKNIPSDGNQEASVDPSENNETGISAEGIKIVEEFNEVWKKLPSDGNQEAFVDPSENIETGISVGRNIIMEEVKEGLNKIPSEENQETSVDPSENIETRTSDGLLVSAMTRSSTVEQLPPQHQVFINVHGKLSYKFVNRIVKALVRDKINVFIDMDEGRAQNLEVPLKTIEESRIALVIFSKEYTESGCRLKELVKIADCVEKGKLVVIPVFYKLEQSTKRVLTGTYGIGGAPKEMWKKSLELINENPGMVVDNMRDLRETEAPNEMWKKSLKLITERPRIIVDNMSSEKETLKKLVDGVKSVLNKISSEGSQEASVDPSEIIDTRIFLKWNKLIDGATRNQKESSSEGNQEASVDPSEPSNSLMDSKVKPPKIQVFLNFRGKQLRNNFIGHLVDALKRSEINVFIDNHERRGECLSNIFKRIEDSGIAIVVFSSMYTQSTWCLNELVNIKERVCQGQLQVLPIFYKVTPEHVKQLKGEFSDNFRLQEYKYVSDEPKIKRWKEAIWFVCDIFALTYDEKSSISGNDFIATIVKEVLIMLQDISSKRKAAQSSRYPFP